MSTPSCTSQYGFKTHGQALGVAKMASFMRYARQKLLIYICHKYHQAFPYSGTSVQVKNLRRSFA
jgi:hypothetical protein